MIIQSIWYILPTLPTLLTLKRMVWYFEEHGWYFEEDRVVVWRTWCGNLKRIVWYFEEDGVVLWRGWCGTLKCMVWYFEDDRVVLFDIHSFFRLVNPCMYLVTMYLFAITIWAIARPNQSCADLIWLVLRTSDFAITLLFCLVATMISKKLNQITVTGNITSRMHRKGHYYRCSHCTEFILFH